MRRLTAAVAFGFAVGAQAQILTPSPDTTAIGYDLVRDRIVVDFDRVAVDASAGFVVFTGAVSLRRPSVPDSADAVWPAATPFATVEATYAQRRSDPPPPPHPPLPPPSADYEGPPIYRYAPPSAVASSRVLRGGRFRLALPIEPDRLEEWVPELLFQVSVPGFEVEIRDVLNGQVGALPLKGYYRFALR